jgi:dTMP kinase|tara:strand:- start:44679 stop:45302 length:624 start_codon:yes stop_codon:yes gene_type:complete
MSQRGTFIVLEGGEGSGKDTQIALLKESLGEEKAIFTREPGGTVIGEQLRSLLMSKESTGMFVEAEILLFLAARAQLLNEVIIPALESGKNVISNRFGLSTIAYQIYGRVRLDYLDFLTRLSKAIVGTYEPDLYVFLDVTPEVGLKRIGERKDEMTRFDEEKLEFHKRLRNGYKKHIEDTASYICIDADKSIEEIQKEISKKVTEVL